MNKKKNKYGSIAVRKNATYRPIQKLNWREWNYPADAIAWHCSVCSEWPIELFTYQTRKQYTYK